MVKVFWRKSIAARISAYAVVLVLVITTGLGLLAYYYGSAAVVAEVERSLTLQVQESSRNLDTLMEHQLELLNGIASQPDMK